MRITTFATAGLACAALVMFAMACGPKAPPENPEGKGNDGGDDAGPTTEKQASELDVLVEKLNAAIQDGDEQAAKAIIEGQTIDLLVEAMGLLPEYEPAGEEIALVDFLNWERELGVQYVLEDVNAEEGTGKLIGKIDGLDEFEGEVVLVEEDGAMKMDFLDLAASRRDEILSDGLAREKFIEIVDKVNKCIKDQDTNTFQNSLTLGTLNAEIELLSYSTKKQSNLSLKGVLKKFKSAGYSFSVKKLDVQTGDAMLTVVDAKDAVVIEGPVAFKTEVGMMRLDYEPLVRALIDKEKAKLDSKKKGK